MEIFSIILGFIKDILNKDSITATDYFFIVFACVCIVSTGAIKIVRKRRHNRREVRATGENEFKRDLSQFTSQSGTRIGGPQFYIHEVHLMLLSVEKLWCHSSSLSKRTRIQLSWLKAQLENLANDLNDLPLAHDRFLYGQESMLFDPLTEIDRADQTQTIISFISKDWNSVLEEYGYEDHEALYRKAKKSNLYIGNESDFPLRQYQKLREYYINIICGMHYRSLKEQQGRLHIHAAKKKSRVS